MTQQKDFKRLVRARMRKTGEGYTSARAQLLKKSKQTPKAAEPAPDYAKLAGMSDAKLKAKTGCTWDKWVKSLDYYGADKMAHRDIAALLHEKYEVGDWWSQTVAVGYERIKGLRSRGQQRNGSFRVSKSRTYNVTLDKLFDAWADAKVRRRWLDVEGVKVRKATASKSIRLGWPDGNIIAVGFFPKGDTKSFVAIEHPKLADRASVDRTKKEWSDRFDALSEVLSD